MGTNTIPALSIQATTLPEGWEKAVIACWEQGAAIQTEYDKPGDPPSRDCTVMIRVEEPFTEPRIHRAFPAGLEDLEVYRQEVVDGVHDHWIAPEEGKWQYTYHERLCNYKVEGRELDQVQYMIDKLSETPYSRRAQAVTWKAWEDMGIGDPACLQRIWCRVMDDKLYCNVHMRSNDAYKAGYMNMFAFTDLQRIVAGKIGEKLGREIAVGAYTHIADSFHIYGSYFNEFEQFLNSVRDRKYEDRVWNSEFAESFFEEGRKKLEAEKVQNK
jgi:thymidylate synthase